MSNKTAIDLESVQDFLEGMIKRLDGQASDYVTLVKAEADRQRFLIRNELHRANQVTLNAVEARLHAIEVSMAGVPETLASILTVLRQMQSASSPRSEKSLRILEFFGR